MITVSCPDCGKEYKLKQASIGKKGRCKVCNSSFTIEDSNLSGDDENEYAGPDRRSARVFSTDHVGSGHPASEDDEFAGLNSVSSDGVSVEEFNPRPPRRGREAEADVRDDKPARAARKKHLSSSGAGFALGGPLSAMVAAGIGGVIGAIVWGSIAYYVHAEVGYVAWGVGGLVGFCVRMAAEEMDEGIAGIIAAIGAVVSILMGKVLAGYFIVQWLVKDGKLPAEIAAAAQGQLLWIAFKSSFGLLDIVFLVLAIATAYRIGSGQSNSD